MNYLKVKNFNFEVKCQEFLGSEFAFICPQLIWSFFQDGTLPPFKALPVHRETIIRGEIGTTSSEDPS